MTLDNEPTTARQDYGSPNITGKHPLHIVAMASPQVSGYTLRTQFLTEAQIQLGLQPSVMVNPVRGPVPKADCIMSQCVAVQSLNGVRYYRYTEPKRSKRILFRLFDQLRQRQLPAATRFGTKMSIPANAWERFVEQTAESLIDVSVVHAHTPPSIGEKGFALAKRLRVPFVYEVRGFWDLSAESVGRNLVDESSVELYRQRDLNVAQAADQVITLSRPMAEELKQRGLTHSRIRIIGNGIDLQRDDVNFTDSDTLRRELELEGSFIIGCFGNIRRLEGIDLVIRAIRQLLDRECDIGALIVGDGDEISHLKALACELRLGSRICFRGQVSPEDVPQYLSLIDAFAIPRHDLPVCRIVSPLKPMQAMAYGKPLVVSDVPALREIVGDEERGLVFSAGSVKELTVCLSRLYDQPQICKRLGAAAHQWVRNRSWLHWAEQTNEVYQNAMQHYRAGR